MLHHVARVVVLLVGLGWMMGSNAQAQADSQSRSERKAEERRMKDAAKAAKAAWAACGLSSFTISPFISL